MCGTIVSARNFLEAKFNKSASFRMTQERRKNFRKMEGKKGNVKRSEEENVPESDAEQVRSRISFSLARSSL